MKRCAKCGDNKPLEDFYRDKRMTSGRGSYCKDCFKAGVHRYYAEHAGERRAYRHNYVEQNPDKARESDRASKMKHKEQITVRRRKRYMENKEHVREVSRLWRLKNLERERKRKRDWQIENADKLKQSRRANYLANREKRIADTRQYRVNNAAAVKERELERAFGKGAADYYAARYAIQDGKCAICGKAQTYKRLALDHSTACCPYPKRGGLRSCGKCRRGLLCSDCNIKLVALENQDWHDKATAYLGKWATPRKAS